MKWFYNLKTAVKLLSAFTVLALLLALVGWMGLNNLGKMKSSLDDMYENNLKPINYLGDARAVYQRIRVNIRDIAFTASSPSEIKDYQKTIDDLKKQVQADIDEYRNTNMSQEEKDIFKNFDSAWDHYNKTIEQGHQLILNNDMTAFTALLKGEMRASGDEVQQILMDLADVNTKLADQSSKDAAQLYSASRNFSLTIIIVAILISVAFGLYISSIISRPLNRAVTLVGKVASGDLRETLDIDTKDEVGQLAASVNNMVLSLRATVNKIQGSAESVAAASQQISASTEEIASGTSTQADSAQVMNERFKELSDAITSVAKSAEQASELSSRTMGIASDGSKVVRTSIEGMSLVNEQMARLEEDSNQIGEIIEVIDDIAEQTNLLALNAAIEAARAGDQGRGFAVVADEVRKLAERSGEATKQITAIIKGMQENTKQSVKAVSEGVASSQRTGESFQNILEHVTESAAKVDEIAAASEQQAGQSSEVMTSIESISAVTEEAAASSEETASTAQSLAQLADDLNRSVSIFKIN